MPPRSRSNSQTANAVKTQPDPNTRYEIWCPPPRDHATLTIHHGSHQTRKTFIAPNEPENALDPAPSLAHRLAEAVLADYFIHSTGTTAPLAHTKAALHANSTSRLISSRLAASPTLPITLTPEELTGPVLSKIISPDTDQWIARYSVPRSTGEGTWTVAQKRDKTWGCSCPRWRFKREDCKHIDKVQQHPDWYPYEPRTP